ncbi:hypothetical protein HF888_16395 (plasmid) [Bermanella marisrubri]|uniref:Uncharacterized protein n=1 Tax=Bermanella marisrubri TaxID=207949 RepID=Q1MY29_9GAMM|nr:hypothetical protein [Bermanella marisrubri]EAT10867.1 hypothetical protein RED65_01973 [Oceanobacter sp. RED65] [Bermanella marisrubri]QIZ85920.1 hypothetical protein HF888_16395 [Bermanella marisrubri]
MKLILLSFGLIFSVFAFAYKGTYSTDTIPGCDFEKGEPLKNIFDFKARDARGVVSILKQETSRLESVAEKFGYNAIVGFQEDIYADSNLKSGVISLRGVGVYATCDKK